MTDFDPFAQTGGPIEGMGGTPRPERRRRRRTSTPRPERPPVPIGDLVDAGFWRRLGALVLDCMIFAVPVSSLSSAAQKVLPKEPGVCEKDDGSTYACDVLTSSSEAVYGLWLLVVLLVAVFVYVGYLEGRRGGTPGKRLAGLRVVRAEDGAPLGMSRAIARLFARFLSAMPFFLGYLWMLWDRDGRTWHDGLTRSRVVKA